MLVSCGGGGGAGGLVPPGSPRAQTGKAAISFFVPATASSGAKRRNVVPASTQSIVVAATTPSGSALTPAVAPLVTNVADSNCSSVSGGLSCTVNIDVPQTTVLFSVASYGGQNGTGALLSAGQTTTTISGASNAVSITLSGTSTYVFNNLEGQLGNVAFDHVNDVFTVSLVGVTGSASGTLTPLANGDVELTITSSSAQNFTVGSVAYFRELANAAVIFGSPGTSAPMASGAGTGGDFGLGTVLQACPTGNTTSEFNYTSVGGPQFTTGESPSQAFIEGTSTVSSAGFSASGTAYSITGASLGSTNTGGSATCSGGVFSGSQTEVAFDNLGVLVSANGGNSADNSDTSGGAGFFNPVTVSISDVANQTYDGFTGGWSQGSSPTTSEAPFTATPGGSNSLQICAYTNFVSNVVATTDCFTVVLTSQPFPGEILGTSQGSPFVASVAQINGKYIIFGLNAGASTEGNFELIEH